MVRSEAVTMFGGGKKAAPKKGKKQARKAAPKKKKPASSSDGDSLFVHSGDFLSSSGPKDCFLDRQFE